MGAVLRPRKSSGLMASRPPGNVETRSKTRCSDLYSRVLIPRYRSRREAGALGHVFQTANQEDLVAAVKSVVRGQSFVPRTRGTTHIRLRRL